MSDRLELPEELANLIEKREQEDRREAERRVGTQPVADGEERRSGQDRRAQARREDEAS